LIRLLVKRVEIDRGDITVVFRVAPPPDPSYGGSDSGSLHHCRRGLDAATLPAWVHRRRSRTRSEVPKSP
ncbi:hypothetical protein, partial [Microvirga tunisiensis]|uniref:hypothetical protein n=1 Tax=Microvirga tunisiensis TaxID=2108360 RepID=UPI001AEE31A1